MGSETAVFKDSVALNEDMFRQIVMETMAMSPKQKKRMLFSRLLYFAATVAVGYEAWFCFARRMGSVPFMVMGAVSVALGVFFLIRGIFYTKIVINSAVRKSMRRQQETGAENRVDQYKFYDEYIHVVTQRYRQGRRIFWKNITRVFESPTFFFVYAKDNNTFFLYKPEISGGTEEEFRAFLKAHISCPIEQEV